MRVLIAGCGYVGTALGLELATAGHEVHGLRRDPAGLPDAIRPVPADLDAPPTLRELPDVDALVVTASADRREPDAYRAAYVRGPRNLVDAYASRGIAVERVLFTSSSAVYGQQDGQWVDEDSRTDPQSATGRILREAEEQIHSGPFPAVVLRLTGIYGPGRTRLIDRVRAREAVCPPTPSYTNRIHRDDAAGALAHLLTVDTPHPVYLGVDHDPADRCTVYRWLAERLGVPPPPVGEDDTSRRGNKRCRNDRLVASGYRLRYASFRDGYGEMLAGAGS